MRHRPSFREQENQDSGAIAAPLSWFRMRMPFLCGRGTQAGADRLRLCPLRNEGGGMFALNVFFAIFIIGGDFLRKSYLQ